MIRYVVLVFMPGLPGVVSNVVGFPSEQQARSYADGVNWEPLVNVSVMSVERPEKP